LNHDRARLARGWLRRIRRGSGRAFAVGGAAALGRNHARNGTACQSRLNAPQQIALLFVRESTAGGRTPGPPTAKVAAAMECITGASTDLIATDHVLDTNAREVAKDHDIGFEAFKAPRRAAKHAIAFAPGSGIFHEHSTDPASLACRSMSASPRKRPSDTASGSAARVSCRCWSCNRPLGRSCAPWSRL
jgi:hypothetical protein